MDNEQFIQNIQHAAYIIRITLTIIVAGRFLMLGHNRNKRLWMFSVGMTFSLLDSLTLIPFIIFGIPMTYAIYGIINIFKMIHLSFFAAASLPKPDLVLETPRQISIVPKAIPSSALPRRLVLVGTRFSGQRLTALR